MSLKEDLQRVYDYDKNEYARLIREQKSYQTELERTKKDYHGRSWIESPFKLPYFTDAEFEKRRQAYQDKYGTKINLPGFNDIIQLKKPVIITAEQMAAHKWAQKRDLPTPLTPDQLESLQGRKYRFLRALSQPTPEWLRKAAAVATFLDNAEDALVTAVVMGRLVLKASPFLSRLLLPKFGWLLLGSDILNTVNLVGQITWAAGGKKRIMEDASHGNPFHSKAAATRTYKLKRTWPTFGESLEILQTVDQMFGVGICLGPIMGVVQDAISYDMQKKMEYGINIVGAITNPTAREKFFADILRFGPILTTNSWMYTPDEFYKIMVTLQGAFAGIWNWWTQNDPLAKIQGLNNITLKPPTADSTISAEILDALAIKLYPSPLWPIIDKPEATIQELVYAYASNITESLRLFAMNNPWSQMAMLAGQQVVETTKKALSAVSDDNEIRVGTTAYASAAKDMARETLQIPPDTPQSMIDELATWIGNYERKTGGSPTTKEIEFQGRMIGIKWDRTFPKITFGKAAEMFPEWKKIQDLLKELSIAD